jgi:hypothetical protein
MHVRIRTHFRIPPVNGTHAQRKASSEEKTLKILQKVHGTGGGEGNAAKEVTSTPIAMNGLPEQRLRRARDVNPPVTGRYRLARAVHGSKCRAP